MEKRAVGNNTKVCDTCRGPNLKSSSCSKQLWPDGDLLEEEEEQYKATLMTLISTRREALCQELHLVARANFSRRLRVVLGVLKECNIDFCHLLDSDGGTALHTAMKINNTNVAILLIEYGGKKLAMGSYTSKELAGISALHLAVINGNREVVEAILHPLDMKDRKSLIHARPTGFLCKEMGDCLTLSVSHWCKCKEVFCDMIKYGAELDAKEPGTGCTVVHSIVRFGKEESAAAIEMLEEVLSSEESQAWWCLQKGVSLRCCNDVEMARFRKYILKLKDDNGCTALTLAAKLGVPDVLAAILNTEGVYKFTDWLYGSSSMARFEMDEIDGILSNPETTSVLDLLLMGHDNVLPAFKLPVLRRLSDAKWDYTWFLFFVWFIYHLGIMITFTVVAVNHPLHNRTNIETRSFPYIDSDRDIPRVWGEIMVVFTAGLYGVLEALHLARYVCHAILVCSRTGVSGWWHAGLRKRKPDIFRVLNRFFVCSTLAWAALRFAGSAREDVAMAIGLATGWYFVLFFSRTIPQSAFFTAMIHRMLFGDLLRFVLTFAALLIGFGTALMVLYVSTDEGVPQSLSSFDQVLLTMFRLLIGLRDLDILGKARSPAAASVLYVAFVCMGTLLLLNMVIAAMSDTYAEVSDKAHLLFLKYRLVSIAYLEDSLPCVYRTRYMVSKYMKYNDHAGRWELVVNHA